MRFFKEYISPQLQEKGIELSEDDLSHRWETWGELYDRVTEEVADEIWEEYSYDRAGDIAKECVTNMMKTAKYEAYSKFILNASPSVWHCMMLNPLANTLMYKKYAKPAGQSVYPRDVGYERPTLCDFGGSPLDDGNIYNI